MLFLSLAMTFPAMGLTPYEAEREIFLSNPEAQRNPEMASSLLTMSVAALGSVMLTTCRPRTGLYLADSLVTFSNTASAYVMSEVISANIHKDDISVRNAELQRLADRMRRQNGGDVQKSVFDESKKEREYLLQFVGMRRDWISAMILGFMTASTIAGDENNTTDNQVICVGTLEAALPVAVSLGLAYRAEVGVGPAETIERYLTGVLGIVAAQLLPMVENPSSRVVMSNLAADATTSMLGELAGLGIAIEGDIADLTRVIDEFISSNGVEESSGVTAETPQPTTETQTGPTNTSTNLASGTSTSTSTSTSSPDSAIVGSISSSSSAANIVTKTCTERTADGKSFTFKSTCAKAAIFPVVMPKKGSLTTRTAAEAIGKLANALALGDIKSARLHSSSLNSMAARIITGKKESTKRSNLIRLQSGQPMVDLDADTKKIITKMSAAIKDDVIKRGGEKFLFASTSPKKVASPVVIPVKEDEVIADLPARLRWKKFHRNNSDALPVVMKPVANEAAAPAPEKEASLWERLTNRYHQRFLGKKELSPAQP